MADDPGKPVVNALNTADIAMGFEAGLAIVLLAIRTFETRDQKHDVQRCIPLSMRNNRFLGVFRGQAPGITLQLPMDTRVNAPGDKCPRNITQSASIS